MTSVHGPQVIIGETWEQTQELEIKRSRTARRNTNSPYLLQQLLKCGESNHNYHAMCTPKCPLVPVNVSLTTAESSGAFCLSSSRVLWQDNTQLFVLWGD